MFVQGPSWNLRVLVGLVCFTMIIIIYFKLAPRRWCLYSLINKNVWFLNGIMWILVDFRSSKSFLGVPRYSWVFLDVLWFSCTKSSKTRKEHITLKTICEHFCRHEINQTSKTLKSQLALKAFCSTAFRTEHIFTKLSNSTKKFCIGFGWDPNFKGT